MQSNGNSAELERVLEENTRLLKENTILLKKIHRNARWSFWVQIGWYLLLIGLPFAFYFYIIEPYFTALGSSYETFNAGMQEIPGWKQFYELIGPSQTSDAQ